MRGTSSGMITPKTNMVNGLDQKQKTVGAFGAQSQFEVLNKAQPFFVLVREERSIINLGIATHNLYSKLKDSIVDSNAELFTGVPNRDHCPVWFVIELDVNNKEEPQERPDWMNVDWAAWSHETDQVFMASYEDLREAADAEIIWSKIKSILSVSV